MLGVLLDVIVQGLAILFLEFRPGFQHDHFTKEDHDSNQDLVVCPLALPGVIQLVSKIQGLVQIPTFRNRTQAAQGSLCYLWARIGGSFVTHKRGNGGLN